MKLIEVLVPGPWWNSLTYESTGEIPQGARVRVPVGRGKRTGFVLACRDTTDVPPGPYRIRQIDSVLDEGNLVGEELWALSGWMASRFLYSRGQILETMLPSSFLKGTESFDWASCPGSSPAPSAGETRTVYSPLDDTRRGFYLEMITAAEGKALVLFPEQRQARDFWESLPGPLRDTLPLWPVSKGRKKIELWKAARRGEVRGFVGSPAALFAPLLSPLLVIVEGESCGAMESQSSPFFNCRSVAAMRARFWGAILTLGGYMPSSRVYRNHGLKCSAKPGDRLTFIDTRRTPAVSFAGIRGGLPVSQPLLEKTLRTLEHDEVALWLLDRKGYAGEVVCGECGHRLTCSGCEGPLRWDRAGDRMVCVHCRTEKPVPERCPVCKGFLLEGNRPGLEALADVARGLLGNRFPLRIWTPGSGKGKPKQLPDGREGLVLGSRGSLSLCDRGKVGLIAWLDADAETRSPLYDARFQAFRMIWESLWRGNLPLERQVLVQSRNPGKDWQLGLKAGWDHFWNRELREREELGLPPYSALVRIRSGNSQLARLRKGLEDQGLSVLDPLEGGDELWLQESRMARIFRALSPFMEIGKPLGDFPLLRAWLD